MNNMTKVLIGVGVVGVAAVGAVAIKKHNEKKYVEAAPQSDIPEEPKTLKERVQKYAMKKAVKFFTWAVLHQNEIQAFATILGVIGSVIGIVNGIKEYVLGKKLHAKLDELSRLYSQLYIFIDEDNRNFAHAWNAKVDGDIDRFNKVMEAVSKAASEVVEETAA